MSKFMYLVSILNGKLRVGNVVSIRGDYVGRRTSNYTTSIEYLKKLGYNYGFRIKALKTEQETKQYYKNLEL